MDVHDVVFAAQRSGFRELLCLIQQYPQHVNVASYATAAIVRIMEKRRQSEDSPAHDDKWSASSDDSDDDVCDHNAMHSSEIVSDLVDIVLKRMETFASDVNMQQWGTRAASCILMHELNKPAETLLQGLKAETHDMHSAVNQELAAKLVDVAYVRQGNEALKSREKQITSLLAHRRLPEHGWDDLAIQLLLHELAQMDSNNFTHNVGAGEREARVASSLVANRCFHLAHGVGRSGDICAIQPKAAGSSLMVQITNLLVKDMLHIADAELIHDIGKAYPGRASNAPLLDLFMTMLHMGRNGYMTLLADRKALVPYFKDQLAQVAEACGERVLHTPHNDVRFDVYAMATT
ncbi:hypothetical protein DYB32_006732 [Aphanomyces invadans]|uniref:O-phosphoseryl-tRNA(Sec) selenium transferase n=1 Tax=Aphanomyces invadans TaxID=157072 RepID=A0A418AQE7_9STRA|nr:hypothetical protein DYB32_006732 [Aphanomyces invadans]